MSYPNSPLSPYSGDLELPFSPGPFYKFVSLSLMVLYQLESLHLDNYNLIYSQNKNRGFDIISFENPTFFPFYKHSSKPIPTNNTKQPQTELKPSKNTLHKARVFLQTQTQEKKGKRVCLLPQIFGFFNTKVPSCS